MAQVIANVTLFYSQGGFVAHDAEFDWSALDDLNPKEYLAGFAQREGWVSFNTIREEGEADLTVFLGDFTHGRRYDSVIRVPIHVTSGRLRVCGSDNEDNGVEVRVSFGDYSVTVAQALVDDGPDVVDVFIECRMEPLAAGCVLVPTARSAPTD